MSTHRYAQVDVFTAVPLRGNASAVVFDAAALGDAQMQDFARRTNLREITCLHVQRLGADVWIGDDSVTCIAGRLSL